MKKIVLVINGAGGVGKDTLCDMAAKNAEEAARVIGNAIG